MAVLSKMQSFDKLRIALIAPMYYAIPPGKYGGTERVVAYLIQELEGMGHSVTLYGANGCKTAANFVECAPMTLSAAGVPGTIPDMKPPYTLQLKRLLADLTNYDVVHLHHGIFPFHPEIFTQPGPFIWTDHTELHVENKGDTLQKLHDNAGAGAISISDSQRDILTGANYWLGTVFNGIPRHLLGQMKQIKPTYLAFLGRLAPEKGAPDAVRVAVLAGKQLQVAAKIEDIHLEYYKREVKPQFERHDVVYVGEITDADKSEFLSGAIALIFPIQWREPFGLVMIEAMACGTPVIAYNQGAVPEVVEEGVTGFIVNTPEEGAAKVKEAEKLDRNKIRQQFEKKFTSAVMAKKYLKIYYRIRDGTAWEDCTDDATSGPLGVEEEDGNNEHVCPGHSRCDHARAEKGGQSAGSNMSGTTTSTTDDLANDFAGLQAGGTRGEN
jgi:glycosyltransferase involved in cell wall biosynthesis